MNQRIGCKKAGLLIAALTILIFSHSAHGGEPMQSLYDLKSAAKLEPRIYQLIGKAHHLFSVPRDNAVGTNDFNNAITLIEFKKDHVVYDEIASDFFKYVSGGELSFLPVFDRDVIGYGQSRRFVQVNLKTADITEHRICYSIEETIKRVAVADAGKRHFIFGIKQYDKNSNDHNDYIYLLRLMDLSGKEPVLIKEKEKPKTVGWFTAYDKIFLFDRKIAAYSLELEPSHHLLAEKINNIDLEFRLYQIYPHPYLSFAVLTGRNDILLSWGKNTNESSPYLTNGDTQSFEYSPDGKWVVFKDEATLGNFKYYLMPVSEKYSHYLCSPILLFEGNFLTTCWTTNPISFVGSTGNKLRRWELTNKAYPQAGDKDLHDYIVEKDLEKLKAEKEKK